LHVKYRIKIGQSGRKSALVLSVFKVAVLRPSMAADSAFCRLAQLDPCRLSRM